MASAEELQEELIRQSTKRLETEHERAVLEEQFRAVSKELANERLVRANAEQELTKSQSELAKMKEKVGKMELELAELSSNLLEQANQQVSEANKRAASTLKLVAERDLLIESQEAQLQALKEMVNEVGEENSKLQPQKNRISTATFGTHSSRSTSNSTPSTPRTFTTTQTPPKTPTTVDENDQLSKDLLLDLDSYSSPLRPIMRTDIREFNEFIDLWGIEHKAHPTRFGKLENPPWRRPRFVQRAIHDDIESTLRLDRTPHLSWLQTRAFMSGVLEQTLVLQPCSPKELPWQLRPSHPCLLCGENRSLEKYARCYWAITSAGAEPIVLDLACVAKTQLACEFVTFLKHIANRTDNDEKTKVRAWGVCNSLKERLFWVRSGGMFPENLELNCQDDFQFNEFDLNDEGIPERETTPNPVTIPTTNTSTTTIKESSVNNNVIDDEHKSKAPKVELEIERFGTPLGESIPGGWPAET